MGIMGAPPPAAWAVNDACAGVLIQGEGVRGSCGLWGTSCFRFANRL